MSHPLENHTAIVTGAAGGIGAAIAYHLSAAGARIIVTDMDREALDTVVRELPGPAVAVAVDLTDPASADQLVAAAKEHYGDVDVLVNNAAFNDPEDHLVGDAVEEIWQKNMAVNVFAPVRLITAVLPAMLAKGAGSIVNISSGAAVMGDMTRSAYAASKAALETMTKYTATQYGKRGVRTNAISPGLILHPNVLARMPADVVEALQSSVPATRVGEPDDIAQAVLFLAGPKSAFVNGQVISVDGGATVVGAHVAAVERLAPGSI